ncbi:MAG: hypothetical protein EHM89_12745, partial [Acidobacteria bacterium]
MPAGADPICCGPPDVGGGATGTFDRVFQTSDGRVIVVEAKGGRRYVNPLSPCGVGRQIEVGGRTQYALQGTQQYFDSVLAAMGEIEERRATRDVILN